MYANFMPVIAAERIDGMRRSATARRRAREAARVGRPGRTAAAPAPAPAPARPAREQEACATC
jgi:hypothetical protein